MSIVISGAEQARDYEPSDITYAIRIFNSRQRWDVERAELKDSKLYASVKSYIFDDISPNSGIGPVKSFNFCKYQLFKFGIIERVAFNEEIAADIIADFDCLGRKCPNLLVHCLKGKGRSPAVAMALNDIFKLGEDTELLMKRFPRYNRLVYDTMKIVSKKR